jgi:zona occludens toxin (predicted ATPase)
MEDIKNLVIKVKYPSSENKSAKKVDYLQKTTVWNIKRLVVAFAVITLLIGLVLFFIMKSSSQESEVNPSVAAKEAVKTDGKDKSNAATKNTIARALLTLAIKNNEPVAELNLPLMLPANKTVPVYYFVEVAEMKDRIIFHEWWLGNKLINRKKITISNNDKWRTVSHQLVAFAAKNNWTVKVVDENGHLIIEKRFDIIEQQ